MYFKNSSLLLFLLIVLSINSFSQNAKNKRIYKNNITGIWYASTYLLNNKELSSVLSPSIEFFNNGTYRFFTTLNSLMNGK